MEYKYLLVIVFVVVILVLVLKISGNVLEKDTIFEITFDTNAGIPFKYECAVVDESVIKLKEEYSTSEKTKVPVSGGPVKVHFVFEPLKEGVTYIKCDYKNFADNYIEDTFEYKVTVDKDLKTTMEKKGADYE